MLPKEQFESCSGLGGGPKRCVHVLNLSPYVAKDVIKIRVLRGEVAPSAIPRALPGGQADTRRRSRAKTGPRQRGQRGQGARDAWSPQKPEEIGRFLPGASEGRGPLAPRLQDRERINCCSELPRPRSVSEVLGNRYRCSVLVHWFSSPLHLELTHLPTWPGAV